MPKEETFFDKCGGMEGIKEVVDHFYYVMETWESVVDCLKLHHLENGKIPEVTKEKLHFFLSGWLGGPPLFAQKYGPPRMRARHQHLTIEQHHADQWLICMREAIEVKGRRLSAKDKADLMNSFLALAMRIQGLA